MNESWMEVLQQTTNSKNLGGKSELKQRDGAIETSARHLCATIDLFHNNPSVPDLLRVSRVSRVFRQLLDLFFQLLGRVSTADADLRAHVIYKKALVRIHGVPTGHTAKRIHQLSSNAVQKGTTVAVLCE
jgi:hypothetical protein